MKGLFLILFEGFFQCFDDLMEQQLKHIEKNYHHYFLDIFLSSQYNKSILSGTNSLPLIGSFKSFLKFVKEICEVFQ